VARRLVIAGLIGAVAVSTAALLGVLRPGGVRPLDPEATASLYAAPLPAPPGPLRVFHLGHSLVGRDMPAMLAQLAGSGHRYESQLGWGTTLQAHWEPGVEIAGFAEENDHPRFRDAAEALASGDYDAVVVTEMVEIRDAIRYFESPAYLARWARRAWSGNPEARVFLYETWHPIDDPEGWLVRLDRDLGRYWEDRILRPALAETGRPVHVIPAGQVLARFVRALERRGGVDGLAGREDLFARTGDGGQDPIHPNDIGAYLVALTHYAVLYQKSPVGLPHRLARADGTEATAPGAEAARLMQEIVWEVVTGYPKTGVPQADAPRAARPSATSRA
jgi:hypothetical protein